jgi:hypothetical protein
MAKNYNHKFKYQQPVKYKGKLCYVETLILNDFVHYQVRVHDTMDVYNCTEKELTEVDPGEDILYGK